MKFYDNFTAWARTFFGKPDATEAELDNVISEQTATLAELISGAGTQALTEQVEQLTERLNGFETNLADLTTQLQERDATISNLTAQITASQTEIDSRDEQITALNAQISQANAEHAKAVGTLSGQIAALKAGTGVVKDENAPVQMVKETQAAPGIVPIKDEALNNILSGK